MNVSRRRAIQAVGLVGASLAFDSKWLVSQEPTPASERSKTRWQLQEWRVGCHHRLFEENVPDWRTIASFGPMSEAIDRLQEESHYDNQRCLRVVDSMHESSGLKPTSVHIARFDHSVSLPDSRTHFLVKWMEGGEEREATVTQRVTVLVTEQEHRCMGLRSPKPFFFVDSTALGSYHYHHDGDQLFGTPKTWDCSKVEFWPQGLLACFGTDPLTKEAVAHRLDYYGTV